MQTILVTGAAGFIGWKTSHLLLEAGYRVVGVDNMNEYYDPRVKEYRLNSLQEREGFAGFQTDIEDFKSLDSIFQEQGVDAVINLAARAGVRYSIENPYIYMSTNLTGTLNLLELMRKYSINKLVLASTSSLYAGQQMPFEETLPVNTPISPYAASKKSAEVLAYTYHFLYGLDISVLRYFTVYGPAGRPDMSIFRFIKWIDEGKQVELFGDGSQSRDFTYVDDIATGTIRALVNVGYEIINLGGGKNPISLNNVLAQIQDHLGKKAHISYKPFHIADMKETWANIDKARKLLDWEPRVSLEEGLKRSVDWYLENREWLKQVQV
ncbi:MAG: SDR family NAD(P)-dependent oxidoreductase [Thermodesulfobacteriota bacterium]